MTEQARWYVIHTYSGYEAMVKDSLEKLIENNNLHGKLKEIAKTIDGEDNGVLMILRAR